MSRPKRQKPGPKPTGRTVQVLVRLSPEAVRRLDREADRRGLSRAALVEEMLRGL